MKEETPDLEPELLTVHIVVYYDNDNKANSKIFFIPLSDFPKSIEDFNIELAKQAKRVVKRFDSSFDEEAVIYFMFFAADEWEKMIKKELLINTFKSL